MKGEAFRGERAERHARIGLTYVLRQLLVTREDAKDARGGQAGRRAAWEEDGGRGEEAHPQDGLRRGAQCMALTSVGSLPPWAFGLGACHAYGSTSAQRGGSEGETTKRTNCHQLPQAKKPLSHTQRFRYVLFVEFVISSAQAWRLQTRILSFQELIV